MNFHDCLEVNKFILDELKGNPVEILKYVNARERIIKLQGSEQRCVITQVPEWERTGFASEDYELTITPVPTDRLTFIVQLWEAYDPQDIMGGIRKALPMVQIGRPKGSPMSPVPPICYVSVEYPAIGYGDEPETVVNEQALVEIPGVTAAILKSVQFSGERYELDKDLNLHPRAFNRQYWFVSQANRYLPYP